MATDSYLLGSLGTRNCLEPGDVLQILEAIDGKIPPPHCETAWQAAWVFFTLFLVWQGGQLQQIEDLEQWLAAV